MREQLGRERELQELLLVQTRKLEHVRGEVDQEIRRREEGEAALQEARRTLEAQQAAACELQQRLEGLSREAHGERSR